MQVNVIVIKIKNLILDHWQTEQMSPTNQIETIDQWESVWHLLQSQVETLKLRLLFVKGLIFAGFFWNFLWSWWIEFRREYACNEVDWGKYAPNISPTSWILMNTRIFRCSRIFKGNDNICFWGYLVKPFVYSIFLSRSEIGSFRQISVLNLHLQSDTTAWIPQYYMSRLRGSVKPNYKYWTIQLIKPLSDSEKEGWSTIAQRFLGFIRIYQSMSLTWSILSINFTLSLGPFNNFSDGPAT